MKSVGFMQVIGLQKLLTSGAIRLVNKEFISKKPRWGIFPQNFRSPLATKLLVGLKKVEGCKNGAYILYLPAKFGGDMSLHGGVRNKSWVFLFLPVGQQPVFHLLSRRF